MIPHDEQLGYLLGKMEAMENKMTEHLAWDKEVHEHLGKTLNAIKSDMNLARNFVLFVKLLALTVIFVVAFKFGDIKDAWKEFFIH